MTDIQVAAPHPVTATRSGHQHEHDDAGARPLSRLILGRSGSRRQGLRLGVAASGWLGMIVGLADLHDWAGLVVFLGGSGACAVWARLDGQAGPES